MIAYYLANRAAVDDYIKQVDEGADQLRQQIEAGYTPDQKARTDHFRHLLEQKHKEQDS